MSEPLRTDEVRRYVRGLLEDTEAFRALPGPERAKMAGDLVRVLSFLTDPQAGLTGPMASGQEELGSNDALKSRLAQKQNLVGKDFRAGAAREGADVFKRLVASVDFPKFVSGLIEGVYTSIVTSSIKQMQAYGKLLEGVVKSVEEFAAENVSLEAARDFVASSFPNAVVHDRSGSGGQLRLKDDLDPKDMPDFQRRLDMAERVELDEDNELKIVLAAQLKMARQRQQQLATMLVMGINRIIVTDGEIQAKVLFDVKSRDTAVRSTQASTYDTHVRRESEGSWWSSDETVDTRVSSAASELQERSTADLDTRAKLSGSVTVRFKSETFPLERLASPLELGTVQEKAPK